MFIGVVPVEDTESDIATAVDDVWLDAVLIDRLLVEASSATGALLVVLESTEVDEALL